MSKCSLNPAAGETGFEVFVLQAKHYLNFNKSCCVRDFKPRIQFAQKCVPLCFILIYKCLDIQRIYQLHGIFLSGNHLLNPANCHLSPYCPFPECSNRIASARSSSCRFIFLICCHTSCILLVHFPFHINFKKAILISALPSQPVPERNRSCNRKVPPPGYEFLLLHLTL